MSFPVNLKKDLIALNNIDPHSNTVKINSKTDQLTSTSKRRVVNFLCRLIYKLTCGRFKLNSDLNKVTQRIFVQLESLNRSSAISIEDKSLLKNSIGKLITVINETYGEDDRRLQQALNTTIYKIQTLENLPILQEQKIQPLKVEPKNQPPKKQTEDPRFPFLKLPEDVQVEVLKYLNEKEQRFVAEATGNHTYQKNAFLLAQKIENHPWRFSKEEYFKHLQECGHLIKNLHLSLSFDPDDEDLNKIILACPNLEKLTISNCLKLSNLGLSNFSKLKHLQSLRLQGENFDNDTLKIITSLQTLKSLILLETSVDNIEKIGDLKNLLSLKIHSNFTGKGIEKLENLKKLKHLDFNHCNAVTNENWKKLGILENLESLSLMGTQFCDLKILDNFMNLNHLDLSFNPNVKAENIKGIAGLKKLKHLNLQSCQNITDKDLEEIDLLDKLETLKISNCKKVTGTCFKNMKRLQHLKVLYLWNINFTDSTLENLNFFQDLEELYLSGCTNVSDEGFKKIGNLKKLQILNLSRTHISSHGLEGLVNAPNLKNLDLENCPNLKDDDLKIIAKAMNLQELNLSKTGISQDSLKNILPLENLKKLNLHLCRNIKSSNEVHFPKNLVDLCLAECKNLKDFKNFHFPENLQKISLQYCTIKDDDLTIISQLKKLQVIYLNHAKISEQGLKKFKELTQDRVDIFPQSD